MKPVTSYIKTRTDETFTLVQTNEDEILNIVLQSKSRKSRDVHDVWMYIVKRIINSIVKPLTHIFNKSLEDGIFPDEMKLAKILPV